jgi:hypothetical protein
MATITNRTDFKNYCLRRLGFPVIEINVYYIKALLQQDVTQKYIDLSQSKDSQNNAMEIVGVTRIFPLSDSQAPLTTPQRNGFELILVAANTYVRRV